MASKVKNKANRKRDGRVKITSQGQVSIPRQALRDSGLQAGDRLQARSDGPGRIVFEAVEDPIMRFIGSMPGAFDREEIERSRDEWDR